MGRRLWTTDEMKVTLSLYFQLPFGRLNHTTREVRELASIIGRSENAVALRLVNFAACDPYIIESGRHGMSGGESICLPLFEQYCNHREELFVEAEEIKARMQDRTIEQTLGITDTDKIGTTIEALVKLRVNQHVFRTMILNNYNNTCAVTGITIPKFLVASHIIPWSANDPNRLNPENGICLSPLYDKLFDQGFISVSPDDYTILLSKELKAHKSQPYYSKHFGSVEHKPLILPSGIEHKPNPTFLEYHNEHIFAKHN